MLVQAQRAAATRAGEAGDDVRPAWLDLLDVYLDPGPRQPLGDESRNVRLAGAIRDQPGRDGIDPDQLGEQLLDFGFLDGHRNADPSAELGDRGLDGAFEHVERRVDLLAPVGRRDEPQLDVAWMDHHATAV